MLWFKFGLGKNSAERKNISWHSSVFTFSNNKKNICNIPKLTGFALYSKVWFIAKFHLRDAMGPYLNYVTGLGFIMEIWPQNVSCKTLSDNPLFLAFQGPLHYLFSFFVISNFILFCPILFAVKNTLRKTRYDLCKSNIVL